MNDMTIVPVTKLLSVNKQFSLGHICIYVLTDLRTELEQSHIGGHR